MSKEKEESVYQYFNRDLSWLSFNYRVLQEAADPDVPLYERLKFLAIYSSNLDEFFRVRVASLRSLVNVEKKKLKKNLGFDPQEILDEISSTVDQHLNEFGGIYRNEILPQLKENKVVIYQSDPILKEHRNAIKRFFRSKVLAYLQPIIFTEDDPIPFLENRALYFVLELQIKVNVAQVEDRRVFAVLNIPSNHLSRFIELPQVDGVNYYMFLDDVIRLNLDKIFPAYDVLSCSSIKINRDAELYIEDEYTGDLVEKIKKHLDNRHVGAPSRFLYDSTMPEEMLEIISDKLELSNDDIVSGGRYHNFNDFFGLPNPRKGSLENEKLRILDHPVLDYRDSLFDAIDERDHILHFPYQSYDHVLRFFNEAAIDPFVTEIYLTVYRIASKSFIGNALISAARNGKHVTVFVEVKARFDEENNLKWAQSLEKEGVRIIYSIPGLKVHAKIALVYRRFEGKKKGYALLSTGNFNESTAKIYADHALMTCKEELTEELLQVFKYLSRRKDKPAMKHLLVAQFNMQEAFVEMIEREIEHSQNGEKAHIIIKLNNLEDEVMIDKLYEASNAGVKVDLIVRGICCLVPQVEGQSKNITITRIVDRYLEHARVFYFYNKGEENLYLSSADWMKRNLYRRIEVGFPILDPKIKEEVYQFLELQLKDNTKARLLDAKHNNLKPTDRKGEPVQSQLAAYRWLEELEKSATEG